MKIAIVFTGRIYKYEEHYENIMNNLVQGNDVDFFVSHSPELQENINHFKELYKPKLFIDDPFIYIDCEKYPKSSTTNRHSCLCMYYNRYRIGKQLQYYINANHVNYDLIISSRTDIFFHKKLDLNLLIAMSFDSIVCIPNEEFDYGGINDQFAAGTILCMNTYFNLYEKIITLCENGCIFHPESLLKVYLDSEGIKIFRFYLPYKIIR